MWKEGLQAVGLINFTISIISSVILFSNSTKEYKYKTIDGIYSETDPTIIAAGLAILVTGLTFIVICFGIAKIIDNQDKLLESKTKT